MLLAAVDLGSNSFRLEIGKVEGAHIARHGLLEGNGTTGSRPRREQQAQQEVDRDCGRNIGTNERALAWHEERAHARGRHPIAATGAQLE